MKKRSISLIEVIISLTLVAVLLSTLFLWYHLMNKQRTNFNHLKWPLLEERYAHQRLQWILSSADTPFFTTQFDNKSLVFIFDNGPNTTAALSGKVLAKLYFDATQHCLCLGIWPMPDQEQVLRVPSETTTLLDGIKECSFSFYHPPDPFKKVVDPEEVGRSKPNEGWNQDWKSSYTQLPAIVKITITRDPDKGLRDHQYAYAFDLPITIIYPKERA